MGGYVRDYENYKKDEVKNNKHWRGVLREAAGFDDRHAVVDLLQRGVSPFVEDDGVESVYAMMKGRIKKNNCPDCEDIFAIIIVLRQNYEGFTFDFSGNFK